MTEQNAPERILANISHLTLVEIDQAEMMRLADEIEYVRADLYDAAIRREKALLASNDEDRKGLVEAASLRHRLKVMTAERDAAWNEAIEAAVRLAHTSINDGGMAKSMAFFVRSEDWTAYKNACLTYSDAIRALRREPRK